MIEKTMRSNPKPTNNPMTTLELHDLEMPPSCKTRKMQTNAPRKMAIPGKSNARGISFGVVEAILDQAGVLKKIKIMSMVAPPMGRLIQKHHLQETS